MVITNPPSAYCMKPHQHGRGELMELSGIYRVPFRKVNISLVVKGGEVNMRNYDTVDFFTGKGSV